MSALILHHFRRLITTVLRCFLFSVFSVTTAFTTADDRVSFRSEVMAVLSRSGCNQGTCHGNANGKGGLKLSLRGQDPDTDFRTLTRSSASRRIDRLSPEASLLLQKPLMMVPHEGGKRFPAESRDYQILRHWIAQGAVDDPDVAPKLVALKASPSQQTVTAPVRSVTLRAMATFSDGREEDVTHLAVFEPSATFVSVNSQGVVNSERSGPTTVVVRYLNQQFPVTLEFIDARNEFAFAGPAPANAIDEAVYSQLKRLRINPSEPCVDHVFLRRVFLDLTGRLPDPQTVEEFTQSDDPQKRSRLIDHLLQTEEFFDFQTLRWADLLRVEDKTLDARGVQVFHEWIRACVAENKPLNEFAAEIIEARGSTYDVPQTNLYRAIRKPEARGEAIAQVFLGVRLQCARCHNHPFDRWTQDDYYGWSNFFARIDYKIIENKRRDKNDKNEFAGEQVVLITDSGDIRNPTTGVTAGLRFLGEQADSVQLESTLSEGVGQLIKSVGGDAPVEKDRLQRLAAWIRSRDNTRFAATQANRIWYQVTGRGVVDPVDDFRSTNPPSNQQLMDVLTSSFIESNYDVRQLLRLIMNSNTYQQSSASADSALQAAWPGAFASVELRRLSAEQLLDGISAVLGVSPQYGGHPAGTRATQLKGVRNGGHRYSKPEIGDDFLKLFGKPNRLQTCDCERTTDTTLAQTFEMISGALIDDLLKDPRSRINRLLKSGVSSEKIVRELYLAALSRPPSQTEKDAAALYIEQRKDRVAAVQDLTWALLNSNEFLLRQ